MKKNSNDDMRVEPIDGAPISLKKVSSHLDKTGKSKDNIYVLIDGSASGFTNDDPHLANVTIEERDKQADYFLSLELPLPPYLKKYLEMAYEGDGVDLEGMYKYAKTNAELKQLIGLIQLVGGSLNIARKQQKSIKLWIEEPETRMHPKRERRIMSLIYALKKDYGFDETTDTTKLENKVK